MIERENCNRSMIMVFLLWGVFFFFALNSGPLHAREGEAIVPPQPFWVSPQPEHRTPGDLFQEARSVAAWNPHRAIDLFQEGLVQQPDALEARRHLAAIYEHLGQWNLAITEYGAVNTATASEESFVDLIRAMEKGGFLQQAAATARKALAKHPGQTDFLYRAGNFYYALGEEATARASLEELLRLKPQEGRAHLLLGRLQEKAGTLPDALRSYLRARRLMKGAKEPAEAVKHLQAGTVSLEGIAIFLPAGWLPEKNGMVNFEKGQRVSVQVSLKGNPQTLALRAAQKAMPEGFFSDERMKFYAEFKKLREEIVKSNPEMAKEMDFVTMPFVGAGDVPGIPGAKMAFFSTSENPKPGMESACAISVPAGGRIYTFVWRANERVSEGQKVLTAILGQIVWSY